MAAPLLAALVVRLACLPLGARIEPTGDANGYVRLAREFALTGRFIANASGVRPPLFRILLAAGFDRSTEPFGRYPGLYLVEIAMDLATLALLMALADRRFGRRAAAGAGWLYALYPPAILYSSSVVMAETIAVLAIAAALFALDRLDRALDDGQRRVGRQVVGLGVVLGLGILSKDIVVPVTGSIALALMGRSDVAWGRRAGIVLASIAIALALTSPWLLYTQRTQGTPALSGTYSDLALALDNPPPGTTSRLLRKQLLVLDGPARRELSHQVFLRALFEYPMLTASRAVTRLRMALGPEDMLPAWIAMTFDGFVPDASSNFALARSVWSFPAGSWGRFAQVACGAATVLLFALGAAGLALVGRGTLVRTAVIVSLALCAVVILSVATARYRQVLVPLYVPFAGLALARLAGRGRPGGPAAVSPASTRRAVACGLVVGAVLTTTIFLLPAP